MTFGPPGFVNGERRGVKFYGSDVIDGIVQTNDEIYFSDTGCPDFSEAEWYLTPGNNGPANGNWGGLLFFVFAVLFVFHLIRVSSDHN